MAGINFRQWLWTRFSRRRRLWPPLAGFSLWLSAVAVRAAEPPIAVFPEAPYDAHIIYQSLAVFWIGIIGLIVILRMKLREIERIQALGADREDPDAPLLQ
jgi:hypothetical protein